MSDHVNKHNGLTTGKRCVRDLPAVIVWCGIMHRAGNAITTFSWICYNCSSFQQIDGI
jgi:hypothetical protein